MSELECDVVMEGGVTSGVVYPTFVSGLAQKYRLRCIGGTSVGAVAAVAAAAAQFQRNASGSTAGFAALSALPEDLGKTGPSGLSNLLALFQPCAELRAHMELLQGLLNEPAPTKLPNGILELLRLFPIGAWCGILFACLFSYCWHTDLTGTHAATPSRQILSISAFILFLLLLAIAGSAVEFILSGWAALRRNRCGICSGINEPGYSPGQPALTDWLHEMVQNFAALKSDQPLTFGQLQSSTPPIELALITTGLAELRSHRLPFVSGDLLFRKSEMLKLFPAAIVAHLVNHARLPSSRNGAAQLLMAEDPRFGTQDADLYFLPPAEQLPIVFAARLSLSFPILLQAVPLYRVRYVDGDGESGGSLRLAPIWLSDGGLTSNFPIHFFDCVLPTRPTFGITLADTLSPNAPMAERARLPTNNSQGIVGPYMPIECADGLPSLTQFVTTLLRTTRGWRDEALRRTPGYRDRVVQIRHTKQEGGLNLNMQPEAIASLSESGTLAAKLIIDRFLHPDPAQNGWLNHRWVRMRSAATVLQTKIVELAHAYGQPDLAPSYAAMWASANAAPASYALTARQRTYGNEFWAAIVASANKQPYEALETNSPRPRPTLEISPRQG